MPPPISSHLLASPHGVGEDAERTLGQDAGADRDRSSGPVKSPRSLTVIRNERPSGAAESENGCDAHQRPRVEEAPEEELPAHRAEPVEPAPLESQRHGARALVDHLRDAEPVAERVHHGDDDAVAGEQGRVSRGRAPRHQSAATRSSTSSLPVGI